jgi:hypothetical protein
MRLSFLLGGIVLGLVVPATGEEAWRPFASAAPEMVPRLETLVDWCNGHRLYRERAEIQEAILAFDPDPARARKGLGYRRGRDGAWERRESWRRPRTTREEHHAEFRERRSAILLAFVDTTLSDLLGRKPGMENESGRSPRSPPCFPSVPRSGGSAAR